MGKRDYVLEKALNGDLDALENVLGGVFAPLYDLSFHYLDDATQAADATRSALLHAGRTVLTGDLGGVTVARLAASHLVSVLRQVPSALEWNEHLSESKQDDALAFLVCRTLDIEGEELEHVAGVEAAAAVQTVEGDSALDQTAWCECLDVHAASSALPAGLIDAVLDILDDEA